MTDIEEIKKEYEEILKQLSNPELISDWEKFDYLSRRKQDLEKIIEKQQEMRKIENQIEENKSLMITKESPELMSLAEEEMKDLLKRKKILEEEIEKVMKGTTEKQAAIIEIRAGVGGEEASLFAGDLFKMYLKYAQKQKWRLRILDSSLTELGGFKEIVFELMNGEIFSKMKYEGGVHRVQRIPETEKSGRIHTSTASAAVLAKPKKAEIKINPKDLKLEFYRASGPGGQYVNKKETAVRITHLPTGIVVTSQTERNQLRNKENALAILEARILERKKVEEIEKLGKDRKTQIGWARRAEKIRTYNFPQDRVTDHRIQKSWHHIEEIMSGKVEQIIDALEKAKGQVGQD